jgi:hypothetical protein
MPFMAGIGESVQKVMKSRDAAAVFGRARTLPSMQIGLLISDISQEWKLLLKEDCVLRVFVSSPLQDTRWHV